MISHLSRRLQEALIVGLLAISLLGIYGSVLLHDYAMRDDYVYLWVVTFDHLHYFDLISAMGRPLYQWLSEVAFAVIDSVAKLRWLRAFTLCTAIGFAWQCYRLLRRVAWSALEAFGLALFIVCTPAIGLYIAWAITFPFIIAMSFGLAAGEFAVVAATGTDGRLRFWRWSAAAVLLALALTIYQHAAMSYWLTLAIMVFRPDGVRQLKWRQLFAVGVCFTVVAVVYFALYRFHLKLLLAADSVNAIGGDRARLLTDLPEKMSFLGDSLALAASFTQYRIIPYLVVTVVVICLAGLFKGVIVQRRWQALLLWLALPVAVYLPSLAVTESVLKIRLLGGVSVLLAIYFFSSIALLAARHRWLIGGLILLAAAYAGVFAQHYVSRDIVQLHKIERTVVIAALREHYDATATQIALVRPLSRNSATGGSPLIEYGTLSSAPYIDFARVLVQQLFAETFDTQVLPEVVQCVEPARRDCEPLRQYPDLPVIDLPELLLDRLPYQ